MAVIPSPRSLPKPHKADCTCALHDRSPRTCDQCGLLCAGAGSLGSHIRYAHKGGLRRKRKPKLVPDGEGFVRRVLMDQTVNVSALSRFAATLEAAASNGTKRKWSRRVLKDQITQYDTLGNDWIQMNYCVLPANYLSLIGRLSLLAGVPVRTTFAALITYGIEHLAKELRATRSASVPHLPQDFAVNLRKRYQELKKPAGTLIPEAEDAGD